MAKKKKKKKKKLGRNLIARAAHFLPAGPTERTGRRKTKERRRQDRLDERKALTEPIKED